MGLQVAPQYWYRWPEHGPRAKWSAVRQGPGTYEHRLGQWWKDWESEPLDAVIDDPIEVRWTCPSKE